MNNNFKKAFTLLELLVVFTVIFWMLIIWYWQLWSYKITFTKLFTLWINNAQVKLCKNFDWKNQTFEYCNWMQINKLVFWNNWFTEVNVWTRLYWNVDLKKYVSTDKKDRRTIKWKLSDFAKNLDNYYQKEWINCDKNTFYIVDNIFFDCKLNKLKFVQDNKNLFKIIDWDIFLKE